jgi:hypothetical protein
VIAGTLIRGRSFLTKDISHANVIPVSRNHRGRDMVYGVGRDAFVNSAAQITVNLNKIAPHGLIDLAGGWLAALCICCSTFSACGLDEGGNTLHPPIASADPRVKVAEKGTGVLFQWSC